MNIAELRRLEAEATPGKWEVSEDNILINEDDEIGELILWSDKDIALIVAMRNALPELLKALEWQPIETAPTGVEILVGGVLDGTWECSVYRIKDKYWREEWCDEPTHWMPLPLPPHGGVDV